MTQGASPSPRVPTRGPRRLVAALPLLALLAGATAAGAQGAPIVAFPRTAGDATEAFFFFDLRDGRAFLVDRLRRDATGARVAAIGPGLFELIGRPTDQPARAGEIVIAAIHEGANVKSAILVESSTGYVAYLDELGKRGQLATITTLLGRPFGPLAAADGNFALLMRRRSGRSVGAYLVYGGTGRGLYVDGVAERTLDPPVSATGMLPSLAGPIAAVALDDGGRTTVGYLLLDEATGALYHLDLDPGNPERITVRPSQASLFDVFPRAAERAVHRRFLPIAIDGDDGTGAALVVDAGSGEIAVLSDPRGTGRPGWSKLRLDLDARLPAQAEGEARSLAVIPRLDGGGDTLGAFVLDGASRTLLYVDRVATPGEATLAAVTLERG